MISQATIEEVKSRASLLDIVGDTIQLKRQGSGYVGLCPFHSERSPSFNVRDSEQFFHCFGCGKSGNVFTYLMESQGLTFPEAVEELANRYGIEIKREGRSAKTKDGQSKKNDIFQLNQAVAQFYREELLKKDQKVVEYVRSRKLTKSSIDAFGVGFAPHGNLLTTKLKQQKIPEDLAVASGILRRNQRGELYDALRGRLIFPIWVDNRKIAGFGGRVIPGLHDKDNDSIPKYINSPESPVYQKSRILYGLPQAFQTVKEKGEVFVVEGYMDVIGLWQVGVRNVVATCGTALTEEHVKRLSRLTKKVIVLFDSDGAGKTAAGKSFLTFANAPVDVWALFVAEGEDPDSIASSYGSKTYEYLSQLERRPLIDCYIEMLLKNYGSVEASELGSSTLGALCAEVASAISQVKDVIARDALIKRASMKLKVPSEKLAEVTTKVQKDTVEKPVHTQMDEEDVSDNISMEIGELPKLDQEILHIVMAKKEEFVSRVLRDSALSQTLHPVTLRFIQELSEVLSDKEADDDRRKEMAKDILKSFGRSWVQHWKHAHEMTKDREISFPKHFEECLVQVRRVEYLHLLARLKQDAARSVDSAEKALLLQQVIELEKRHRGMVPHP